jgi:hypothetical protein
MAYDSLKDDSGQRGFFSQLSRECVKPENGLACDPQLRRTGWTGLSFADHPHCFVMLAVLPWPIKVQTRGLFRTILDTGTFNIPLQHQIWKALRDCGGEVYFALIILYGLFIKNPRFRRISLIISWRRKL